jgi:putative ABC transport system permease protein
LREGGRAGSGGRGNQRLRAGLVVCEIALSLVLLLGAGLLLRSFLLFEHVNPGFTAPAAQVLTMHVSPNRLKYDEDEKAVEFHQRMLESIARLPGVAAAGISDSLPPDDVSDADTFVIEGQSFAPGQMNPAVTNSPVSPGYFRALGIPLRRGRYFTELDTAKSSPVVIISESMAQRFFSGQDPIGRRLKASGPELTKLPYMEIVGVVGDVKYCGFANGCEAAFYQPFTQNVSVGTNLVVRSAVAPGSLIPALLRAIHAIDPDAVVNEQMTLETALADMLILPRVRFTLLAIFAGMAMLLAAIGIYGVMSYAVAQRTHEIGIRLALGARPRDVLRLVARQGTRLALAGIALGLLGAAALTGFMQRMLFGVSATDPLTFACVPLVLLAVALAATWIPARRAVRIDPTVALRCE